MSKSVGRDAPHVFEQDDIAHLRRHLGMPDMPYVDFSARRECEKALQRWPLLAELTAPKAPASGAPVDE